MLTEQQERDVLAKSIEAVTALTGKHPKGWTAPSWKTSSRSIKLLEEFGLVVNLCFTNFQTERLTSKSGI